jgi:hypothetical protein
LEGDVAVVLISSVQRRIKWSEGQTLEGSALFFLGDVALSE